MDMDRRAFLQGVMALGAGGVVSSSVSKAGFAPREPSPDAMGVLVDLTKCIGCRKCEWACNNEPGNGFREKRDLRFFDDKSVFKEKRRHSPYAHTVVNKYPGAKGKPVYVKTQCMHCVDPSCLSACLVTAFSKEKNGAVSYDEWRCMGCRYCVTVCPFEVPSYEYDDPVTPRVRKCTLCFQERTSKGRVPACVEICPVQCLTYGKRSELLQLARERIANHPDDYIDKIYGETEVGGTSWLYISNTPFEQLGFLHLPDAAPPRLVEGIQHGIFHYFISPIMLFGVLGAAMWTLKPEGGETKKGRDDE